MKCDSFTAAAAIGFDQAGSQQVIDPVVQRLGWEHRPSLSHRFGKRLAHRPAAETFRVGVNLRWSPHHSSDRPGIPQMRVCLREDTLCLQETQERYLTPGIERLRQLDGFAGFWQDVFLIPFDKPL